MTSVIETRPKGTLPDRTRPRHPRRAVTLIEALVASVLLGVGVVGLMSSVTLGLRNQLRSQHQTAALYLANAKLAEVETVGPYVWSLGYPTESSEDQGDVVYRWTLDIERMTPGELFRVCAQVDWSTTGDSGSVEMETWLNDYQALLLDLLEEGERELPFETSGSSGE